MYLASLMDPRDIVFEQRALSQRQIYQELVELICRNHKLPVSAQELFEMVVRREEEAPMAYPSGIAIPHIRLDGFADILVAVMFLQEPVHVENTHISWAVFIITDKSSSKTYLNLVAALMKLSKDAELMPQLQAAGSGQMVQNLLNKWGISIKKDLYIEDIMTRDTVSVQPQVTLRELIRLMSQHRVAGLPVVDEHGIFLGEVNILALFKVGIPDYLMSMNSLDFLTSFEPLEQLLEKQDELLVKDIMLVENEVLKPKTSIIEAVNEMIRRKKRYWSVVDGNRLVGVVTAMDVFTKVIQA